MSVEIVFPVEFVVEGVPASLQGKGLSLPRWKEKVAAAARLGLPEWHLLWEGPISVTILYFPGRVMADDIDNIIKPILDALCRLVYFDDQQVERLVVQKFEPGRPLAIENLTRSLEAALDGPRPAVYIRVDGGSDAGDSP